MVPKPPRGLFLVAFSSSCGRWGVNSQTEHNLGHRKKWMGLLLYANVCGELLRGGVESARNVQASVELTNYSKELMEHTEYENVGACPCLGWLGLIRSGIGLGLLQGSLSFKESVNCSLECVLRNPPGTNNDIPIRAHVTIKVINIMSTTRTPV